MRVLITGGAGFIASRTVDAALAAGLEPVVLDLRPPYLDLDHVFGDVGDADGVEHALRRADLVCHRRRWSASG